jgi:hypothetical protein
MVREQPADGWAALVAVADRAPNDQVLADLASTFLLEIIETRADEFAVWIVRDAPTHPNLRRALRLAVRESRHGPLRPQSAAMPRILTALAENGTDG